MTAAAPTPCERATTLKRRTPSPARPRVAFVVNGVEASAMGERARSFAGRLHGSFDPVLICRHGRKGIAAARMLNQLFKFRPNLCYVLDLGFDGLLAALLYGKATGVRFAVDTGDDVVALGRALGRGRLGMFLTQGMDRVARRTAAAWVVRGRGHRELFASTGLDAEWIPDGVEVDRFAAAVSPPRPDKSNPLVIGMLGSVTWIPTRNTCYGWELVELVALLSKRLAVPVRGEVIGDGDGIQGLKNRARELGIEDRIRFHGRIPLDELPAHLARWHVALSTQTNDAVGHVRTTGKLPLYLAAGRFVLATDVGEASRVLPEDMRCPYAGEHDPGYPKTLANRIEDLLAQGVEMTYRPECVELARTYFDYNRLAARLEQTLGRLLETSP
jgi:glycosyltransferase involved in cell wall biosynthesis